jgi:putative transposase
MAKKRKRKTVPTLDTIWEISDDLWERIRPILEEFWPKKATGRKVANWRRALNGIVFRMRSGCQWDQLPAKFGAKSTVHDWFQRWNKNGVMEKIMATLIEECEDLSSVYWNWQSADGAMAKARFGGIASARIPQIAEKTARNAACSLTSTAAHSV